MKFNSERSAHNLLASVTLDVMTIITEFGSYSNLSLKNLIKVVDLPVDF